MTTEAAERLYLAQHLNDVDGRKLAIFNPHDKPVLELPIIYGFNNGGKTGWYQGVLLSEDGYWLGSHICSHEGYMPHDLGCLEGSRDDRHDDFKKRYPDGYRMQFVRKDDVDDHEGLAEAVKKHNKMDWEH